MLCLCVSSSMDMLCLCVSSSMDMYGCTWRGGFSLSLWERIVHTSAHLSNVTSSGWGRGSSLSYLPSLRTSLNWWWVWPTTCVIADAALFASCVMRCSMGVPCAHSAIPCTTTLNFLWWAVSLAMLTLHFLCSLRHRRSCMVMSSASSDTHSHTPNMASCPVVWRCEGVWLLMWRHLYLLAP